MDSPDETFKEINYSEKSNKIRHINKRLNLICKSYLESLDEEKDYMFHNAFNSFINGIEGWLDSVEIIYFLIVTKRKALEYSESNKE